MLATVHKDYLDDSISGNAIDGGTISGLDGVFTDSIVGTTGSDAVFDIGGKYVDIGYTYPIGSVRATLATITSSLVVRNSLFIPTVGISSLTSDGSGKIEVYDGLSLMSNVLKIRIYGHQPSEPARRPLSFFTNLTIGDLIPGVVASLVVNGNATCMGNLSATTMQAPIANFGDASFKTLAGNVTVLLSKFYTDQVALIGSITSLKQTLTDAIKTQRSSIDTVNTKDGEISGRLGTLKASIETTTPSVVSQFNVERGLSPRLNAIDGGVNGGEPFSRLIGQIYTTSTHVPYEIWGNGVYAGSSWFEYSYNSTTLLLRFKCKPISVPSNYANSHSFKPMGSNVWPAAIVFSGRTIYVETAFYFGAYLVPALITLPTTNTEPMVIKTFSHNGVSGYASTFEFHEGISSCGVKSTCAVITRNT